MHDKRILLRDDRILASVIVGLGLSVLSCGGAGSDEASGDAGGAEVPGDQAYESGVEGAERTRAPGTAGAPTTRDELSPAGAPTALGEPRRLSVPAGTTFRISLDHELSTETSAPGDRFTAAVGESLLADGGVAVPARSTVRGTVTAVQHSGAAGRPAVIKLSFDELVVEDRTYPLQATLLEANPEVRSRTSTAEGAAKVGAGAAAGAIIGRVIGGDVKGTLIGAAVGAAAGTAIVLGTGDADAVLPAGSEMTLRLDRELTVERRVEERQPG